MKLHKNQSGFSPVEIIIVIVMVGLTVAVGWLVYDRQQKSEQSAQTQATINSFEECVAAGNPVMESYPEQCSANGKSFTKKVKVDEQRYLEIKEWGVKIPLVESSQEAYYYIENDPGRSNHAYLSLTSLKQTDCAAEKTSQIAITRFKEGDMNDTYDMPYTIDANTPRVGEYYFVAVGAQAMCSEDEQIQTKATKLRTDVVTAIKSIKSID